MSDTTNHLPNDEPPSGNTGWRGLWIIRLAEFIFVGVLWRFIARPFYLIGREIMRYVITVFAFAVARTAAFGRTSWTWLVDGYVPSDDLLGRLIDRWVGGYMRDPWIRIPFTIGSLVVGTPLMFVLVLLIGFGIPVAICLTIDQLTYPQHKLAEQFRIDGPNAGQMLTAEERGILVTDALVHQLEFELDSVADMTWEDWRTLNFNGFWGWTPNDMAGFGPLAWPGLFDNRKNRQLGVIYAVRIMTDSWSRETSKLGSADRENVHLVRARTEGFSLSSRSWFFPAAESYYRSGIADIRTYQDGLRSGDTTSVVNVTTRNLANVLRSLNDMLQEPYGRLIDRNATVAWTELDDTVFYAQGAAIVARDMLAAIAVAYKDEFSRGQLDRQVSEAISSLSAAAVFNPLYTTRGDGDSMISDARSKVSRYISEALRRTEDIYRALES